MIGTFVNGARRFAKEEDGNSVLPFALWAPLLMLLVASGLELGFATARFTMLEHAMDKTVRDLRLGTGTIYDRDSIKGKICDYAGVLPECESNLELEMVKLDIRDWGGVPTSIHCADMTVDQTASGSGGTSEDEVKPVVQFEYGRENELMLLLACYKYEPLFPTTGLGERFVKDEAGYSRMVAEAAFVHEPI